MPPHPLHQLHVQAGAGRDITNAPPTEPMLVEVLLEVLVDELLLDDELLELELLVDVLVEVELLVVGDGQVQSLWQMSAPSGLATKTPTALPFVGNEVPDVESVVQ